MFCFARQKNQRRRKCARPAWFIIDNDFCCLIDKTWATNFSQTTIENWFRPFELLVRNNVLFNWTNFIMSFVSINVEEIKLRDYEIYSTAAQTPTDEHFYQCSSKFRWRRAWHSISGVSISAFCIRFIFYFFMAFVNAARIELNSCIFRQAWMFFSFLFCCIRLKK